MPAIVEFQVPEPGNIIQQIDCFTEILPVIQCLADLPHQKFQIVSGIPSSLGQAAGETVPRNHYARLQRGHPLECLAPFDHLTEWMHAEHAVIENEITGIHDALFRQPGQRITGEMAVSGPDQLDMNASKIQVRTIFRDDATGIYGAYGIRLLADSTFQPLQMFGDMPLLGLHRTFQGDDLDTFVRKIAVTQPMMVLGAYVDNPANRYGSDVANCPFDQPGSRRRGSGADQYHSYGGDDEAKGIVQTMVFRGAAGNLPHQGPSVVTDLPGQQFECPRRDRKKHQEQAKH